MIVELAGFEVFGYHGVEEEERREGQMFLFDVWLEVGDDALSDRIEDAVDYRRVADTIRDVSGARSFNLLEALAAAASDAILAAYPVEGVRVRVRKPEVGLPVEFTAATAERRR